MIAEAHPSSWYVATARGLVEYPSLTGTLSADVCVVGAGYTGLSAALHLAERGYSVVVLEAQRVGWGASGRNGGQIGTGQRCDEAWLEAHFGPDTARQLFRLAEESRALVRTLISRHAIDCELGSGQLLCAAKPAHLDALKRRAEKLARDYDYPHQSCIARSGLSAMLGSSAYFGASLDTQAAYLHPLNYALGLARACREAGVRIFEQSAVRSYDGSGPVIVKTAGGQVQTRLLVLACNAHLDKLEPRLAATIMPINNFLVATAPLGEQRCRELIRDPVAVHDTLFVLNYFRLSTDGRLIFGGGENYRRRFPADIGSFVRPHLLRVFSQLGDVKIDYAWGGRLAITMNRMPHFGRLGPNVYFAQGYSGHGVAMATLAGQLLAEAVAGSAERFDVFARLAPPPFPGGTLLRWPGLVLGMLWYALRDRLP
ncbi:MAG: FAD-binding oxidoreductase [Gammaproteobacteria bacterium]